jgi:hypothetical protein
MPVVLPEPTNSGLYATNRVYITAVFDRDTRRKMDRDRVNAAALAPGIGPKRLVRQTSAEPALPLFLLFLQEIISERDRLPRRKPGVSRVRGRKEQRAADLRAIAKCTLRDRLRK